jgi:hypothetical protein
MAANRRIEFTIQPPVQGRPPPCPPDPAVEALPTLKKGKKGYDSKQ